MAIRRVVEIDVRALKVERDLKKIESATRKTEKSIGALKTQFEYLGNSIKFAIVGFITTGFAQFADAAKDLETRLGSVQQNVAAGNSAFEDLLEIANKTGTEITSLGASYTKLGIAVPTADHEKLIATMDTLSTVLSTTGASTQQVNAVLLQMSQALGSGALQGDEFRSVFENAPVLLRAWQKAAGFTGQSLRSLSSTAQLTTESFLENVDAISAISKEMTGMEEPPLTVARAFVRLRNEFTAFIKESPVIQSIFDNIAKAVAFLADNLDVVVTAITLFAGGLAGKLLAKGWTVLKGVAKTLDKIIKSRSALGLLSKGFGGLASAIGVAAVAAWNFVAGISAGLDKAREFSNEVDKGRDTSFNLFGNISSEDNLRGMAEQYNSVEAVTEIIGVWETKLKAVEKAEKQQLREATGISIYASDRAEKIRTITAELERLGETSDAIGIYLLELKARLDFLSKPRPELTKIIANLPEALKELDEGKVKAAQAAAVTEAFARGGKEAADAMVETNKYINDYNERLVQLAGTTETNNAVAHAQAQAYAEVKRSVRESEAEIKLITETQKEEIELQKELTKLQQANTDAKDKIRKTYKDLLESLNPLVALENEYIKQTRELSQAYTSGVIPSAEEYARIQGQLNAGYVEAKGNIDTLTEAQREYVETTVAIGKEYTALVQNIQNMSERYKILTTQGTKAAEIFDKQTQYSKDYNEVLDQYPYIADRASAAVQSYARSVANAKQEVREMTARQEQLNRAMEAVESAQLDVDAQRRILDQNIEGGAKAGARQTEIESQNARIRSALGIDLLKIQKDLVENKITESEIDQELYGRAVQLKQIDDERLGLKKANTAIQDNYEESQKRGAKAAKEGLKASKTQAKLDEKRAKDLEKISNAYKSVRGSVDKLYQLEQSRDTKIEKINAALEAQIINEDEHATVLAKVNAEHEKNVTALEKSESIYAKLGIKVQEFDEILLDVVKNSIKAIQTNLADAFYDFFNGTLQSAKDWANKFKEIVLRMVANLASQLLTTKIVVPLAISATGLGGSTANAAVQGATGGGGFSVGNLAKAFTSAFSSSSFSIGETIGHGVEKVLFNTPLSDAGSAASANLANVSNLTLSASTIGGGIAASFANDMLYGKGTAVDIGGGIGSAAGAAFAPAVAAALGLGPVGWVGLAAGALIGGIAGGGIGSLFGGGKPERAGAAIRVSNGRLGVGDYQGLSREQGFELMETLDGLNKTLDQIGEIMGPEAQAARAGVRGTFGMTDLGNIEGTIEQAFTNIVNQMAGSLGKIAKDAWKRSSGDLNSFARAMQIMGASMETLRTVANADPLNDYVTALERSNEGIAFFIEELDTEIKKISDPKNVEELAQLAQLSQQRYELELQFIDQVANAMRSVVQLVDSARESILLANTTQQQQYEYWRNETNATIALLENATDPAEIQRLSERGVSSVTSAFNALPPEQQELYKLDFLGMLDYIESTTESRLKVATEQAEKEFETMQAHLNATVLGNEQRAEEIKEQKKTNQKLDRLIQLAEEGASYAA